MRETQGRAVFIEFEMSNSTISTAFRQPLRKGRNHTRNTTYAHMYTHDMYTHLHTQTYTCVHIHTNTDTDAYTHAQRANNTNNHAHDNI